MEFFSSAQENENEVITYEKLKGKSAGIQTGSVQKGAFKMLF